MMRLVLCLAVAGALNVVRNKNFGKLQGGYLFPEIGRRRTAFAEKNPELAEKIISLGIGDTTKPIPEHILSGLVNGAKKLGTVEGYSGYGAEQGRGDLRAKIAEVWSAATGPVRRRRVPELL